MSVISPPTASCTASAGVDVGLRPRRRPGSSARARSAGAACSPSSPARASRPPPPRSPRARGCDRRRSTPGSCGGTCRAADGPAGRRPCRRCPRARRRRRRSRRVDVPRSPVHARPERPMSSGSSPRSSGLRNVTICCATAAGPGPGRLRKLLPSMPSSVVIESTPMGSLPSGTPNTASEFVCAVVQDDLDVGYLHDARV